MELASLATSTTRPGARKRAGAMRGRRERVRMRRLWRRAGREPLASVQVRALRASSTCEKRFQSHPMWTKSGSSEPPSRLGACAPISIMPPHPRSAPRSPGRLPRTWPVGSVAGRIRARSTPRADGWGLRRRRGAAAVRCRCGCRGTPRPGCGCSARPCHCAVGCRGGSSDGVRPGT